MENESKSAIQDFTKKTWRDDLTLIVEGKRLYVAKNILAIISPVFEAMFSQPFSEKNKEEIELHGKQYDGILEFLKCVYPSSEAEHCISANNVFQVLPFADEYQVKKLKDKCENYLRQFIWENGVKVEELFKCLAVAEQYNLDKVKDNCIDKLAQSNPVEVVDSEFESICPASMLQVMKRIVLRQSTQLELAKIFLNKNSNEEMYSPEGIMNFENAKGTVLNFTVTDVSAEQVVNSPAVDLWGFKFSALIKYTTKRGVTYFGLFLALEPPVGTAQWSCKVKARLILKSLNSENLSRDVEHTFTPNEDDWGFNQFASMQEVLNPDMGFLRDNM